MKRAVYVFIALVALVFVSWSDTGPSITWADFQGKPDWSSIHCAYITIDHNYRTFVTIDDTPQYSPSPAIDKRLSWVKPGYATPELLEHERGHLLIAWIAEMELSLLFFDPEHRGTFWFDDDGVVYAYKREAELNAQYDAETNHGMIKAEQGRWSEWLSKEFDRLAEKCRAAGVME